MQLRKRIGAGLLGLLLLAGLAGCGSPTSQTNPAVTLPAGAEARDSAKASLATPAPDAASTTADSAARTTVTPR